MVSLFVLLKFLDSTWMIIPVDGSVVNNHGDRKSPKDRVVGPLPNGLFMAYINGGYFEALMGAQHSY